MECEWRLSPHREVYLAVGFRDIARAVKIVPGNHSAIGELEAVHEEADSCMFLHVHTEQTVRINRVLMWRLDTGGASMCPRYFSVSGVTIYSKEVLAKRRDSFPYIEGLWSWEWTCVLCYQTFMLSVGVNLMQLSVAWEKRNG